MNTPNAPALLFEMLRSFVSLANTLNLTATVNELGSTRQTIRRHIAQLENYKGARLFELRERSYTLTETGRNSLREATQLMNRCEAWLFNETGYIDDLQQLSLHREDTPSYLQQHPLTSLWSQGSALSQFAFQAWAKSEGQIESAPFAPLRPYLMIFRFNQRTNEWICTEIGDKSSFSSMYGWEKYRSSIGKPTQELPSYSHLSPLIEQPFHEICVGRSIRLDHIFAHTPTDNGNHPISYHRLLMGCRFADGELALASLVDRTKNISIKALPEKFVNAMSDEWVMDVAPPH